MDQVREIRICITPPFWQTWWFRLLMIALFIAGITGWFRVRLNNIRKEEAVKLATQQKIATIEMKALRAQMNPHFIFNSLNSINRYILRNETQGASNYLSNFASLMRMILDNSQHATITLESELDMLEKFVDVEKRRFPNPMNLELRISDAVDTFDTRLPGMLLQPFVENAIWHGLAPRDGQGNITIDINQEDSCLVCIIEDDGVGRHSGHSAGKTHESKALQITKDRLGLYDIQHGTHSSLEIQDKTNAQGQPAGTKVIIRLGLRAPSAST